MSAKMHGADDDTLQNKMISCSLESFFLSLSLNVFTFENAHKMSFIGVLVMFIGVASAALSFCS